MTNQKVLKLQKALNAQGYRDKNGNKLAEDGLLGAKTTYALQKMLNRNGYTGNGGTRLAEDGIWGANTQAGYEKYSGGNIPQKNTGNPGNKANFGSNKLAEDGILRPKTQYSLDQYQQNQSNKFAANQKNNTNYVQNKMEENFADILNKQINNTQKNTATVNVTAPRSWLQEQKANDPNLKKLAEAMKVAPEAKQVFSSSDKILSEQIALNALGFTGQDDQELPENGVLDINTLVAWDKLRHGRDMFGNANSPIMQVVNGKDDSSSSDIKYYSQNGMQVWADMNGIQSIGFDENGKIICGNNLDPLNREMLQLKLQYEQPGANKVDIQKKINEIKATRPDLNTVSYEKPIEYYRIVDVTERIDSMMHDAEKRYSSYKYFYNRVDSILAFLVLVASKCKYDLKVKDEFRAHSLYIYDGEIVDREVLGNIVYGYLGRVMGIDEPLMYAAPGVEQIGKGTSQIDWWDSNFDDPRDQGRIEQGIKIYDEWHKDDKKKPFNPWVII